MSKTFAQAGKGLDGFKRAATGALAIAGGAATAAAGALVGLTVSAIHNADEMGRLAQTVSIPVDVLSRLAHAANMSDVSTEALTTSLRAFQKTITAAVNDPASDAAGSLSRMGIALKDATGALRPTNDVLLELSDRFRTFQDDASKSTLAMELFGKSGTEILPFLNQGKQAIEELGAKANVVTPEMAEQASKLNENIRTLKTQFAALGFTVAQQVLPQIVATSQRFVELGTNADGVKTGTQELVVIMQGLATALLATYHSMRFVATIGSGALSTMFGFVYDVVRSNVEAFKALIVAAGQFGEVFTQLSKGEFAKAGAAAKAALSAPLEAWTSGLKQAWTVAVESGKVNYEQILTDAQNFKNRFDAIWAQASNAATTKDPGTGEPKDTGPKIGGISAAEFTAAGNDRLQAEAKLWAQSRQQYADYQNQIRKVTQDRNQQTLEATSQLMAGLAHLAQTGGKKMFGVWKAFAIAHAIIDTWTGANKALASLPYPANIIAAAAVVAEGLANVATISSTKPAGQAHSGMDYVPSTGSYVLERGEAVVRRNENARLSAMLDDWEGGGRRGVVREQPLNIFFGTERVAEIILEMSRDGRLTIHPRSILPA